LVLDVLHWGACVWAGIRRGLLCIQYLILDCLRDEVLLHVQGRRAASLVLPYHHSIIFDAHVSLELVHGPLLLLLLQAGPPFEQVHVLSDFDDVKVPFKNFILDLRRVLFLERGFFFFRVVRRSLERVLGSVLSAVSVQHV
jgi:hypothetical protein